MAEVFVSKVRPLGTSLGLIIPNKVVSEEKLEPGEEIKVSIIKSDFKALEALFGSMKGAKPFKRDKKDRI